MQTPPTLDTSVSTTSAVTNMSGIDFINFDPPSPRHQLFKRPEQRSNKQGNGYVFGGASSFDQPKKLEPLLGNKKPAGNFHLCHFIQPHRAIISEQPSRSSLRHNAGHLPEGLRFQPSHWQLICLSVRSFIAENLQRGIVFSLLIIGDWNVSYRLANGAGFNGASAFDHGIFVIGASSLRNRDDRHVQEHRWPTNTLLQQEGFIVSVTFS